MGDHDEGAAGGGGQQVAHHHPCVGHVEVAGGLVEDDGPLATQQRAGQGQALALTSRQGGGVAGQARLEPVGQASACVGTAAATSAASSEVTTRWRRNAGDSPNTRWSTGPLRRRSEVGSATR